MFSIAAINDVEATPHAWQPLAPTKEAQEFRLTEMYHESLLHLQAGEYKQAQKLLETIIKDPLSINAESQGATSFDPMRQLRFLSFRNLAEAFLKQGPQLHKDALQCFLNAVSIDEKDVTLWNRLGTLACSLDSKNIARWAFEQGLLCSPHHWACMEKLIEVLIAIGDESACLSVVKRLLKISPSHPRALLVKRVIEDNVDPAESVEVAEKLKNRSVLLRGIDKLKPYHYSLSFAKKRKFEDLTPANEATSKNVLQLSLKEASLTELLSKLLEVFESINTNRAIDPQGDGKVSAAATHDGDGLQSVGIFCEEDSTAVFANAAVTFSLRGKDICKVEMPTSMADRNGFESKSAYVDKDILCDETQNIPCEKKMKQDASTGPDASYGRVSNLCEKITPCEKNISARLDASCDKVGTMKERDTSTDEEPHLERRSSRIERIRTRNFDKIEELESVQPEVSKSKVSSEELLKLLEPFIVCKETSDNADPAMILSTPEQENSQALDCLEERNVLRFLREHALNSGVYHVAQKLLERLSMTSVKPIESWTHLLRIEKYIRSSSRSASPFCSLFLAEVYMDMTSSLAGELETKGCLEDCDYHLCKVTECFAATFSSVDDATFGSTMPKDLQRLDAREQQVDGEAKEFYGQLESCQWSFWVRFYWISGQLHYYQGNCEMANDDFNKCLRILQARKESEMDASIVKLPHCGIDKQIDSERVQHKLHEVQIQGLLSHSAAQMLEAGQFSRVIELLEPILLRDSGNKGMSTIASKKIDFSTELTALNLLIDACEKCEPNNFRVALQCYNQRLRMHLLTAGIVKVKGLSNNLLQGAGQHPAEGASGDWFKVVAEEVKRITRFLAGIDQKVSEKASTLVVDATVLGCMQQLLLIVMSQLASSRATQRFSNLVADHSEQSETGCFVEAAISFCRLQHLHNGTSVEDQVELLVTVHDLLADRGLCCAGKACEGGEGVFLKMAIKHYLLLEMKLKSTMPEENPSTADETSCDSKDENFKEGAFTSFADDDELIRADEVPTEEKRVDGSEECSLEKRRKTLSSAASGEQVSDFEELKNDLGLDIALDQSFFCLYGLKLRGSMESCGSQDGLAVHANTSLGDYQTKEQCAEVFQYLLPYARVCTKSCLVKLRKVLRSIRHHFRDPPEEVLENNAVDIFLDDMELDESKLSCLVMNHAAIKEILEYVLKGSSSTKSKDGGAFEESHIDVDGKNEGNQIGGSYTTFIKEDGDDSIKSGLYQEVYRNLYYLLTQVEEASAGDKWPGFVFTKEGEDFVEQNAKIIKYDLIYNIGRFESWHKLANLFDEEVDLMLNDGSKTCSALEWHKNENSIKRVEIGRRRTRRCLLMSMALAKTPEQERSVHELLALVYYDTIQNVAPSFNQRHQVAVRDAAWQENCQKSLLHFKKGLSFRSEWMYLFYLGKLCEKLGEPCEVVLRYYQKAFELNSLAVDALYRLHASRLKLLCSKGTENLDIMKVVAKHSYNPDTVEQAYDFIQASQSVNDLAEDGNRDPMHVIPEQADKAIDSAWNVLFEDGIQALEVCIEGELKHYHKARYRLAQSLYARNKGNDIERAKEELGFCFKSNRSLFIINMWEIDGSTRKTRRKMPGSTGAKRSFEITMPESSRKFITCLRKYLLFYLHLCERTFDICTLERAYCALRVDKKFSLCLADMVQVALGKYIHTLGAAIVQFDSVGTVLNLSLKNLLERFFNLFIEHGGSWSDVVAVSLAEAGVSSAVAVSEIAIYSYIHRYLHSLERDYKVDVLESVNEKIKKRFKTPKLVKEVCARVCKHAAIAWCRCLCSSLCAITPLQTQNVTVIDPASDGTPFLKQEQLMVDLKIDELFSNMSDFYIPAEEVKSMQQFGPLSCMTGVQIQRATAENMERATTLLKQTFTFYRDCTGPFPAGINLFLVQPELTSADDLLASTLPFSSALIGVDLSVPRKLLLWAYTLVHGHTCSIAEAARFCEEQAKTRVKKGAPQASPPVSFQDKPALKDATGSSCAHGTNDIVVDDKEKLVIEEHDTSERSCRTLVCFSETSRVCPVVPSSRPTSDDPVQKEENCKTIVMDYVDAERSISIPKGPG